MRSLFSAFVIAIATFAALHLSEAPALQFIDSVSFPNGIKKDDDLSALAPVGSEFLVVGSDETRMVQILKRAPNGYVLHGDVDLLPGQNGKEIDIEGIAVDGKTVYVTGSHGRARDNKEAVLGKVEPKKTREQFFRFKLDAEGNASQLEQKSLMSFLEGHSILSGFVSQASKENGIDIEGLAFKNGRLYFGFRSPVLRDNWVPVVSCEFDNPSQTANVAYIQMAGRGIREICAIDEGFLILGGPSGEGDQDYRLYLWDGQDAIENGNTHNAKELAILPRELAAVAGFEKGKPEGLTILKREGKLLELLLLSDGLPNGSPTRWKLSLP
jgi:hypothetical protein